MYPDLENCIAFNLRKLTRLITRRFNEYIVDSGINYTQFCILLKFLEYEKNKAPNTYSSFSKKIVEELGMERTGLRLSLKRLSKNGFLEEKVGYKNSYPRSIFILTDKGRMALQSATDLHKKCHNKLKVDMSARELSTEQLINFLKTQLMEVVSK